MNCPARTPGAFLRRAARLRHRRIDSASTNDGDVAHRLQHPRYEVRRVYEVLVSGAAAPATRERLLHGVQLEDGPARALNAQVIARTEAETRR